ncbi:MAG: Rap1a/Tai family immunity protein [Pseudomonadota bacterium]
MRPHFFGLATAAVLAYGPVKAAEPENFTVDTAADLARLCAIQQVHPNYAAAIHFCHGYLVGLHHFQVALSAELERPLYCAEAAAPQPTRDSAAADFASWVESNPELGELEALDAVLTWATEAYPCP